MWEILKTRELKETLQKKVLIFRKTESVDLMFKKENVNLDKLSHLKNNSAIDQNS